MGKIIKHRKFCKSDFRKNNNKFWYITQTDDHDVTTEYGRIGASSATQTKHFSSEYDATKFFDKKIKEKLRGKKNEIPYREIETVNAPNAKAIVTENLSDIASKEIGTGGDTEATKLIQYLSKVNVHNILSNTTMSFNKKSGLFETPCGIVTTETIDKARVLLVEISDYVAKNDLRSMAYGDLLNDYLMLIPQDVGRKFQPQYLYRDLEDIKKQNDILDSLLASIQSIKTQPQNDDEPQIEKPKTFHVDLLRVEDSKIIDRIRKKYRSTQNSIHSCSHLDVKRVFTVDIKTMREKFEKLGKPLGTVWELWHGTRASNLLSILKGGLIVPPSNASNVTGRMFSNCLYFSDQSTKSLNYAYGYWGGGKSDNCFMFLADVAMGNYKVPSGPTSQLPPKGYNSYFAKAHESGVRNNEMIVPNVYQCNLTYLIEFSN